MKKKQILVSDIEQQFKKYSYRRKALVKKLQEKGISNLSVLNAVEKIPRHSFVDSALVNRAYDDRALPIGCGQTISQPYTVAVQTELLRFKGSG